MSGFLSTFQDYLPLPHHHNARKHRGGQQRKVKGYSHGIKAKNYLWKEGLFSGSSIKSSISDLFRGMLLHFAHLFSRYKPEKSLRGHSRTGFGSFYFHHILFRPSSIVCDAIPASDVLPVLPEMTLVLANFMATSSAPLMSPVSFKLLFLPRSPLFLRDKI